MWFTNNNRTSCSRYNGRKIEYEPEEFLGRVSNMVIGENSTTISGFVNKMNLCSNYYTMKQLVNIMMLLKHQKKCTYNRCFNKC